MVHDENDKTKAFILTQFFDNNLLPRPFGIIYCDNTKATLENGIKEQITAVNIKDKKLSFNALLMTKSFWEVC